MDGGPAQPGARAGARAGAELVAAAEQLLADDPAAALEHATEAVVLAEAAQDDAGLAAALVISGQACVAVGDAAEALEPLERAIRLAERVDDQVMRFDALNNLARLFLLTQQTDRALQLQAEVVALAHSLGDPRRAFVARVNQACVHMEQGERDLEQGRPDHAQRNLRRSLELSGPLIADTLAAGERQLLLGACVNRAAALVNLGQDEQALAELEPLDQVADEVGLSWIRVNIALYRVKALLHLDRPEQAYRAGTSVIELARSRSRLGDLAQLHEVLCDVAERRDDHRAALEHHRAFHRLHAALTAQELSRRVAVVGVQLQTERALNEAATERLRAAELAQQAHLLSQEAMTDQLTGLANRRRLEALLDELEHGRDDAAHPVSLALIDIDHFKQINDRFSHAVGDDVLRRMGALLTRLCRTRDVAARYGGEEFVVILDGADARAAALAGERFRAGAQGADWTTVHPQLTVTISVGICQVLPPRTVRESLHLADAALYRAKNAGRNQVQVAEGSLDPVDA